MVFGLLSESRSLSFTVFSHFQQLSSVPFSDTVLQSSPFATDTCLLLPCALANAQP